MKSGLFFIVMCIIGVSLCTVSATVEDKIELCQSSITGELEPCSPSSSSLLQTPVSSIPSAAHLYKSDHKYGFILSNQSIIYPFLVSGERTYLEWIVVATDCVSNETPSVLQEGKSDEFSSCDAKLSLYVYLDCDPSASLCTPSFSSIDSANAYIGVSDPQNGSIYYAEVESVSGSGTYKLITRSYAEASSLS